MDGGLDAANQPQPTHSIPPRRTGRLLTSTHSAPCFTLLHHGPGRVAGEGGRSVSCCCEFDLCRVRILDRCAPPPHHGPRIVGDSACQTDGERTLRDSCWDSDCGLILVQRGRVCRVVSRSHVPKARRSRVDGVLVGCLCQYLLNPRPQLDKYSQFSRICTSRVPGCFIATILLSNISAFPHQQWTRSSPKPRRSSRRC